MRVTKNQISTDIRFLLSALAPFGLSNTEQVAALLRDEKSDDPTYPSGAYLRLMLSKTCRQDPSERFCDKFYKLKEWVESQLSNGGVDLATAAGRLIIRDGYEPSSKINFVTTPSRNLGWRDMIIVEDADSIIGAMVYIPPDWIGQCHVDTCARFFPRRTANAKYCPAHSFATPEGRRYWRGLR